LKTQGSKLLLLICFLLSLGFQLKENLNER
jgi:hypothetical protein